jgi:hypothetical protein
MAPGDVSAAARVAVLSPAPCGENTTWEAGVNVTAAPVAVPSSGTVVEVVVGVVVDVVVEVVAVGGGALLARAGPAASGPAATSPATSTPARTTPPTVQRTRFAGIHFDLFMTPPIDR